MCAYSTSVERQDQGLRKSVKGRRSLRESVSHKQRGIVCSKRIPNQQDRSCTPGFPRECGTGQVQAGGFSDGSLK
jgi:hypothetical protein